MSLEYGCLVAFRILSTVFVQNGYVHPDEFFQTTEIITGKWFSDNSWTAQLIELLKWDTLDVLLQGSYFEKNKMFYNYTDNLINISF